MPIRVRRDPDISEYQVTKMIEFLTRNFGVKTPSLIFNPNSIFSYYTYKNRTITLGACHPYVKSEDVVLHEFAHHLAYAYESTSTWKWRGNIRGHGLMFQTCLRDVAFMWYKDVRLYDWKTEYSRVVTYAYLNGLIEVNNEKAKTI